MTKRNVDLTSEISRCLSAVDQIDNEIVALLNERFEISRELASIKRRLNTPITNYERDILVLKRVSTLDLKSPDRAHVVAVFRQILQESRAVQLKTREAAT